MNRKVQIIIVLVVFFVLLGRLYAGSFDEKYLTIDPASIVVEKVDEESGAIQPGRKVTSNSESSVPAPSQLPTPPAPPVPAEPEVAPMPEILQTGTGDDIFVILEKIINIGEKIFSIIERNKPVVDIKVTYANAVPYGITHWTQLAGWQKPKTQAYVFSAKNVYGMEVVKVKYQVHSTYGGAFKGKGKFLTGVTIEPISVTTAWGYTVNLVAEVPDSTIANVGTDEDPIASMQVQLKWKIATVLKEINEKSIYYVQGDGLIEQIATPFKDKNTNINNNERVEKIAVNKSGSWTTPTTLICAIVSVVKDCVEELNEYYSYPPIPEPSPNINSQQHNYHHNEHDTYHNHQDGTNPNYEVKNIFKN